MTTVLRRSPAAPAPSTPPVPPAVELERERMLGAPVATTSRQRWVGWIATLAVTAVAALLRFWHLGQPHKLIFDETYYVKQAYTMLHSGLELQWPNGADKSFTAGTPDVYSAAADYPVHPPIGKWMISVGEWLFGIDSSTGWRFSSAVVGTLTVLMVARIGRRMLGSTLLGATAGLLLAVDGLHLVMSRTGILDVFIAFWAVAAFGLLLLDRDWSRRRIADAVAASGPGAWPRLWWRPYRFAAAVCLGLCCGVKWSGLYFFAAFAVMSVLWDVGARHRSGARRWPLALVRDGVPAAVTMVPTVLVVYLAAWTGWFVSDDGHLRQWAVQNPGKGVQWLPPALRSLWKYHQDMWYFHTHLDTPHDYMSNPWSWIVQGRPTSFFYEGPKLGQDGCHVAQCSRAITSLGNPVIWWAGGAALFVLLFAWALRRDWRAGAILCGVAAGWLPWFQYTERTIFTFYAVAFVPFLVLGLTYVLAMVLGPPGAPRRRRMGGAAAAGAVVVAAVAAAAFFWPVWTAQVIPYSAWHARMWFVSWI